MKWRLILLLHNQAHRYHDAVFAVAALVQRHGVLLFLAGITLVVFGRIATFDFVSFDDPVYVYENKYVQAPFTAPSLRWAFTTNYQSNWHPVTWLSHMGDYALFGPRPGAHHLVNLLFHFLSTLLLYWVLSRFTGAPGRSAVVASLFAIHPLHVESVVWISERKDVLSVFLGLLSLTAYCCYTRRSSWLAYAGGCLALALALMSKSMLVSMPLVMLLFDYWPLGRFGHRAKWAPDETWRFRFGAWVRPLWRIAVLEKLPLFALAAVAAVVAMHYKTAQLIPAARRAANACVAYTWYIEKFFWPTGLSAHHPYPFDGFPWWRIGFSVLFLVGITTVVVLLRRKRPYLALGWFWYLFTLAPAAGFVQIGSHLVADRYSYLSSTGLAIMVVWSGAELASVCRVPRWLPRVVTAAIIAAMIVVSYRQVGFWRNNATLCERSLAVNPDDGLMLTGQANEFFQQGRYKEAVEYFHKAARIAPAFANAYNNLGLSLVMLGRVEEALSSYQQALALDPGYLDAHVNIAVAFSITKQYEEAIRHLLTAQQLDPEVEDARTFLVTVRMDYARLLVQRGHVSEAIDQYRKVTVDNPNNSDAWFNLASSYEFQKNTDDAVSCYQKVLELNPSDTAAREALARLGRPSSVP